VISFAITATPLPVSGILIDADFGKEIAICVFKSVINNCVVLSCFQDHNDGTS
jgi:hypothetical protein